MQAAEDNSSAHLIVGFTTSKKKLQSLVKQVEPDFKMSYSAFARLVKQSADMGQSLQIKNVVVVQLPTDCAVNIASLPTYGA
jgi:hypothetical protein